MIHSANVCIMNSNKTAGKYSSDYQNAVITRSERYSYTGALEYRTTRVCRYKVEGRLKQTKYTSGYTDTMSLSGQLHAPTHSN